MRKRWLRTLGCAAILAALVALSGVAAAQPGVALAGRDSVGSPAAPAVTVAPRAKPDYVAQVRANFTPENRVYSSIRSTLGFIVPLYDIAIALLLLFSGFSARMRDFAYARTKSRYLRVLIYFVLFSAAFFLLDFPFNWYQGYWLEHRFQLSNQTFGAWLAEQGKDLAVNVVFLGGLGLIHLAYLAIAKSPRRWWLWLTLGTLPVILFAVLLQPIVIDSLYNKFTPLRDQELKARIIGLAEKAGIPGRNVYQVNKSKQTRKINAYVTGFGASQRIVLWDTTLQQMKEDEILFVMGHEMGHYKLRHIWKGIAFNWILSGLLFYASWFIMNRAVRRFGPRWRFTELYDIASLPLLFACLNAVSLVAQPMTNTATRLIEHEADVFGLEVTHSNDAAARAFIKLGAQNRSNPEPSAVVKYFQYTHPPLIERIRFATSYRPWEEGKPNRAYHGRE